MNWNSRSPIVDGQNRSTWLESWLDRLADRIIDDGTPLETWCIALSVLGLVAAVSYALSLYLR